MLIPAPADLPASHPTTGYWQIPPSRLADLRSTPILPSSADYVVIGSGITGSSIALNLLKREPTARVVTLEARQACSGATGRNGGHCRAGDYLAFAADLAAYGREEAIKISRFEEQNIQDVTEFIRSNEIDCDLKPVETVDLISDEGAWKAAVEAVETRHKVLSEYSPDRATDRTIWSVEDARETFKCPSTLGAITFAAWTMSPYKLTCGILALALRSGLNLQTNTPALSIVKAQPSALSSQTPTWSVQTARGSIVTPNVILATNAYTSHLYPALAKAITPTRAQICAQRPGSALAPSDAFLAHRSYSFVYPIGHGPVCGLDYMITRAPGLAGEGDVILGGGRSKSSTWERPLTDDSEINKDVSDYLKAALTDASHFGVGWGEKGEVVREWTGIQGYTEDFKPLIGQAPGHEGFWVCAGFNGHGMALAFRSAMALVEMIMKGKDNEELCRWLPETYRLSRASMAKHVDKERAQELGDQDHRQVDQIRVV